MTELFAQPYDISAQGFYFDSVAQFEKAARQCRNAYGQPIEEFEIQFIDGEDIDAALFKTFGVNQANIDGFFTACEAWDEWQKQNVIIAVGECGYGFELGSGDPDAFDVDVYELESMRELAEQMVEEGLFGDIPQHLQAYIDYEAIARDLSVDYSETTIAGKNVIYRCS